MKLKIKKSTNVILITLYTMLAGISCQQDNNFRDFGIDTSITNLFDQNGNQFDLKQLEGSAIWVFFGFTHCPEICPMTQSKLSKAWQKIGYRKKYIKSIFITVDPERDTVQLLNTYLSNYTMKTIGLTGETKAIKDVTKRYGIYYEKVPLGNSNHKNYTVNHTSSVFLLDTKGQLRYIFPYRATPDKIASVTKLLLPFF